MREKIAAARRVIVKVGSSLLTASGSRLDIDYLNQLSAQIAHARANGREIAVVSSGSVAAGVSRLGWRGRPKAQVDLQVAAAVGQMILVNAYESAFAEHRLHAAQILLTAEDMSHRTLYLNARTTLRHLLKHAIIPVINENDAIATDAVRFGDNDRLAAQVANLLEADVLLLVTDVPGLCRDPVHRRDVIAEASANDASLANHVVATDNGVGSGGMASKLLAAQTAARSGADTLIIDGTADDGIARALSGDPAFGTLLCADIPRLSARKQWLASGLYPRGTLALDDGAVAAVVKGKRSVLSAGVTRVTGDFVRGDAVVLQDSQGKTIGYGLCNYDCAAAHALCGVKSGDIAAVLGYAHEEEIVHRDNMTILR